MRLSDAMQAHLAGGVTTLCRAWAITRRDGVQFGFTDHDCTLNFNGLQFKAQTGLSASQLEQATGLSVDNAEALGLLRDSAVREADIVAGRFDGAEVLCWLVNWADVQSRALLFRGQIGEIERSGGAFRAELRGLTDQLNDPFGRAFHAASDVAISSARARALGGVDLDTAGYVCEHPVLAVNGLAGNGLAGTGLSDLTFADLGGFEPGWFSRGRLTVLDGAAAGLQAPIKADELHEAGGARHRRVTLWQPLGAAVAVGDLCRLEVGDDRRFETWRLKFNNAVNFQGFPDIPGEDWLMAHPAQSGTLDGGSRR